MVHLPYRVGRLYDECKFAYRDIKCMCDGTWNLFFLLLFFIISRKPDDRDLRYVEPFVYEHVRYIYLQAPALLC